MTGDPGLLAGSAVPCFILSSPRSGSTLLRIRLGALPGVLALPETHFFVFRERFLGHDLMKRDDRVAVARAWTGYYTLRRWPIEHRSLQERIEAEGTSWPAIFWMTAWEYARAEGIDPKTIAVLCEKSPPHVFRTRAIRAMMPDARFIGLVRDPRSVVSSLKNCSWSTSNALINARVWRRGVQQILSPGLDPFVIRYEDLVSYPRRELERLARFLGVTERVEVPVGSVSDAVIANDPHGTRSLQPITTEHIERWRNTLSRTDRELEIIQAVCRKEMARFGYTSETEMRDLTFFTKYLATWIDRILVAVVRA